MEVAIEPGWKSVLAPEFEKPYFQELAARLHAEKRAGKTIYPPGRQIFRAFELTPFDQVKVVILGQDPYHNPGQAEGLSFSVPHGVPAPPSLKNIYKEIETDLGVVIRKDGSLESWATFTDAVIRTLSERRDGLVFLLWGNFARSKKALIDSSRHTVLEAAHPSPLAGGAFFGCRHFSKANTALLAQGLQPIDWTL